jgi:membrane protein implicated in regulation of membrane protease activity
MLTESYLAFWIAGGLVVALAALEICAALFGVSTLNDGGEGDAAWAKALSWLNPGRVPGLVLAMLGLGLFSASGFALQAVASAAVGPLPWPAAVAAAGGVAFAVLRPLTYAVARVLPRDETYASRVEDLVGEIARVTLGPIQDQALGRVRVVDKHGNPHFPLARAADPNARLDEGATVVIVGRAPGAVLVRACAPDTIAQSRDGSPNALDSAPSNTP